MRVEEIVPLSLAQVLRFDAVFPTAGSQHLWKLAEGTGRGRRRHLYRSEQRSGEGRGNLHLRARCSQAWCRTCGMRRIHTHCMPLSKCINAVVCPLCRTEQCVSVFGHVCGESAESACTVGVLCVGRAPPVLPKWHPTWCDVPRLHSALVSLRTHSGLCRCWRLPIFPFFTFFFFGNFWAHCCALERLPHSFVFHCPTSFPLSPHLAGRLFLLAASPGDARWKARRQAL